MFVVSRRMAWLVASVLAVLLGISILPASAWNGEADEPALYSACVGPALEDAGFTDVRRYPADTRDAIDCLAHYEITFGTGPDTFAPDDPVRRKHMALFLTRAAGPAGIDLPRPSNRPAEDFRDVAGLSIRTREAIDQLVQLGITQGKTRTTFDPDATVTRRQMALFLYRFLELAPVGPGGIAVEDAFPDDRHFEDLGNLPLNVYEAVRTLFEMGVVEGTSSTTFSPARPVTRAEMALAITRMLGHTNARPAGITVQTDGVVVDAEADAEVVISIRDRWHRPVTDALVDMFEWDVPDSRRVDPFDAQGRCEDDQVRAAFGNDPCVIGQSDDTTDVDGNLVYDVFVDEDLTLWAWTGDLRDRFDLDRTEYVSIEFTAVEPPDAFKVTDDMHPEAEKMLYGRSVTFTFQLVDVDGKPVSREDVEIEIRTEERSKTSENQLASRTTRTYYTDSGGQVTIPYHINRARYGDSDTESELNVIVVDRSGLGLDDATTVGVTSNPLVWSRDAREPTTLVLSQTLVYHTAESSGARNRVTATLIDQYGDPVRGETVHFRSDDDAGLGVDSTDGALAKENYRKDTSRRGEATVTYVRNSANPGIETFSHTPAETSTDTYVEGESGVTVTGMVEHYWVLPASQGPAPQGTTEGELVHHDTRRSTFVIKPTSGGPFTIAYDSRDYYYQGTSPIGYDVFLERVMARVMEGDTLTLRADVTSHRASATNTFTIVP